MNKNYEWYLKKLHLEDKNIESMMGLVSSLDLEKQNDTKLKFAKELWDIVVQNRRASNTLKGDEEI